MADEDATSPDSGDTVEDLQAKLEERKRVLVELRATREQAQRDAEAEVTKAALRAEIKRVNDEIRVEKEVTKTQKEQNPEVIAAGPQTPPEEVVLTPGTPDAPDSVTEEPPAEPPATPSTEGSEV